MQLWISLIPKLHLSHPQKKGSGQLPILFSSKCTEMLTHRSFLNLVPDVKFHTVCQWSTSDIDIDWAIQAALNRLSSYVHQAPFPILGGAWGRG